MSAGSRRGGLLRAALGRQGAGLMEAGTRVARVGGGLPTWALGAIPLALIAVAIGAFALLGGPGLGERTGPPVEEVAVERTVLRPGEIELTLRNDGPDPVEVAQVAVNDAYAPFVASDGNEIGRLGSTTLEISYPWIEGEAYEIFVLTSTGGTIDTTIPVATETPEADVDFYGLMALLGIYVGVIPVSLGMLWLPFLGRLGRRWMSSLIAFTVGLLAFLAIDAGLEGLEIAAEAPAAFGGASLVFVGALAAYLALAGVDAHLSRRRPVATGGVATGGAYLALLVAIGIGLHNLGEGLAIGSAYATGALALGAFLVVGFAIHNTTEGLAIVAPLRGGAGDRAERPRLTRLLGLGLIAGGAGDPRRLDRRLRLQPQPGGAALRRRRRRDRPRDRADGADDARRGGAPALPVHRRRDARRHRRPLPHRTAGVGLMAARDATGARRAPSTEAIEDYAKAIYAISRQRDGLVLNGEVAERLGVTPATATSMLKRLAGLGLVDYMPYKGVSLTPAGREGGAGGDPPPPADRGLPLRGAGDAGRPRPRGGGGARALHLRGPGAADRGQARRTEPRPPRYADPGA